MSVLEALVLDTITAAALAHPRSLQQTAGVSDVAGSCDYCLACRLAGREKVPEVAWLARIGTAVHSQLAEAFEAAGADWLVEHPVEVGHVGPLLVRGTADLIHLPSRTVIDHKLVGVTTMRKIRRDGPPANYVRQAHLYAYGLGARRVALNFLPRTSPQLSDAIWWEADADARVAEAALARAARLQAGIAAAGDEFIDALPRDPNCFDCGRSAPLAVALNGGSVLGSLLAG